MIVAQHVAVLLPPSNMCDGDAGGGALEMVATVRSWKKKRHCVSQNTFTLLFTTIDSCITHTKIFVVFAFNANHRVGAAESRSPYTTDVATGMTRATADGTASSLSPTLDTWRDVESVAVPTTSPTPPQSNQWP